MNMIIKNSIFDGTLLEGYPITFQWRKKRPKNIYYPAKTSIYMRNYRGWYNENYTTTKENLRRMFMHDFGHMMLYARQNQLNKLCYSNFGLTWDVDYAEPYIIYNKKQEFLDEVKVSAFEFIINHFHENGIFPSKNYYIDNIYNITNHIHFKNIETDMSNEQYIIERNKIIENAYDYWCDMGIEGLKQLSNNIKIYLWNLYIKDK